MFNIYEFDKRVKHEEKNNTINDTDKVRSASLKCEYKLFLKISFRFK